MPSWDDRVDEVKKAKRMLVGTLAVGALIGAGMEVGMSELQKSGANLWTETGDAAGGATLGAIVAYASVGAARVYIRRKRREPAERFGRDRACG